MGFFRADIALLPIIEGSEPFSFQFFLLADMTFWCLCLKIDCCPLIPRVPHLNYQKKLGSNLNPWNEPHKLKLSSDHIPTIISSLLFPQATDPCVLCMNIHRCHFHHQTWLQYWIHGDSRGSHFAIAIAIAIFFYFILLLLVFFHADPKILEGSKNTQMASQW